MLQRRCVSVTEFESSFVVITSVPTWKIWCTMLTSHVAWASNTSIIRFGLHNHAILCFWMGTGHVQFRGLEYWTCQCFIVSDFWYLPLTQKFKCLDDFQEVHKLCGCLCKQVFLLELAHFLTDDSSWKSAAFSHMQSGSRFYLWAKCCAAMQSCVVRSKKPQFEGHHLRQASCGLTETETEAVDSFADSLGRDDRNAT